MDRKKLTDCVYILMKQKDYIKKLEQDIVELKKELVVDKTKLKSKNKKEEKKICKFVISSGKNKGKQCSKNCKEDIEYCQLHLKKIDKK